MYFAQTDSLPQISWDAEQPTPRKHVELQAVKKSCPHGEKSFVWPTASGK